MPIYAYRCEDCGHELDALQKVSDAPLTDCPACGASALKKQITAAAFRLKGAGWYETDFKQDGKKNLHETGDKDKDTNTDKDKPKTADGDKKADVKADKSAEKPATTKTETAAPKPKPEAKPKPSGAAKAD
jgi:putative FmdB family regulatory protein